MLSGAKLSYGRGKEWERAETLVNSLRPPGGAASPNALRPGPFRSLLEAGLVPFLTEIFEDRRVQYVSDDIAAPPPVSAVSMCVGLCDIQLSLQGLIGHASCSRRVGPWADCSPLG